MPVMSVPAAAEAAAGHSTTSTNIAFHTVRAANATAAAHTTAVESSTNSRGSHNNTANKHHISKPNRASLPPSSGSCHHQFSPQIIATDTRSQKQPTTTYQHTNQIHLLTSTKSTLQLTASTSPTFQTHHKMTALGPFTRLSSSQLTKHQPPNQTNQPQGTNRTTASKHISV